MSMAELETATSFRVFKWLVRETGHRQAGRATQLTNRCFVLRWLTLRVSLGVLEGQAHAFKAKAREMRRAGENEVTRWRISKLHKMETPNSR